MNLKSDAKLRRKSADYKKMAEIFTQLLRQTRILWTKRKGGLLFCPKCRPRGDKFVQGSKIVPNDHAYKINRGRKRKNVKIGI